MHKIKEMLVSVNGEKCRILQKGSGERLGYFSGIGGMPKWFPFLDLLAEKYCVIVPSLPGFPGGGSHHQYLDHLDWLIITKDLLAKSGLKEANIIASSVSAPLLADIAALWTQEIKSLILISPFGIFEDIDPIVDIWAQRPGGLRELLCENKEQYDEFFSCPSEYSTIEWEIIMDRAMEATARYLFPFGDTGIRKRLIRIEQPTLLLRGSKDMIVPKKYIDMFSEFVGSNTVVKIVESAGHIIEIDKPEITATEIINFLREK